MTKFANTRNEMRKLCAPASGVTEQTSDAPALESRGEDVLEGHVDLESSSGATTPGPADAGGKIRPDRKPAEMQGSAGGPVTRSRSVTSRSLARYSPAERLSTGGGAIRAEEGACGEHPPASDQPPTREFENAPEGGVMPEGRVAASEVMEGLERAQERLLSPQVKAEADQVSVVPMRKILAPGAWWWGQGGQSQGGEAWRTHWRLRPTALCGRQIARDAPGGRGRPGSSTRDAVRGHGERWGQA